MQLVHGGQVWSHGLAKWRARVLHHNTHRAFNGGNKRVCTVTLDPNCVRQNNALLYRGMVDLRLQTGISSPAVTTSGQKLAPRPGRVMCSSQ